MYKHNRSNESVDIPNFVLAAARLSAYIPCRPTLVQMRSMSATTDSLRAVSDTVCRLVVPPLSNLKTVAASNQHKRYFHARYCARGGDRHQSNSPASRRSHLKETDPPDGQNHGRRAVNTSQHQGYKEIKSTFAAKRTANMVHGTKVTQIRLEARRAFAC